MAENEDGQEKSEEPTGKKIEDARKKGQIARSRELNTMVLTLTGVMTLTLMGNSLGQGVQDIFVGSFVLTREEIFDPWASIDHLTNGIAAGISMLLPFFGLMLVAAIASSVVMGGFSFSTQAMQPKLEKFNVFKGIKKIFALKGLVELIKALVKFFMIGGIGLLVMIWRMDEFLGLGGSTVGQAVEHGISILVQSSILLASSLIILALFDVPYQLWDHKRQLKMTKQEVKDENKQTEGKPEVKQRIRRVQYEMAHRRMMEAVPEADVIVTNPTHFAVALKYDADKMAAPIVVAKGADLVAANIRRIAQDNDVHIVESPVLARAVFYSAELNEAIPAGLYLAVAQLLAYVFQLNAYQNREIFDKPNLPDQFPVPDDLKHD